MLVSKFCQRSWQVVNQFNCKTWQLYQELLFSLAIYKPVLALGAFGAPLTSSLFWSQIDHEVAILSLKPFQTLWQALSSHPNLSQTEEPEMLWFILVIFIFCLCVT